MARMNHKMPTSNVLNQTLGAAIQGDETSRDVLWNAVYEDLKRRAHYRLLGEPGTVTLSTTDLVNETFLKLLDHHRLNVQGRNHFLALCCRAMRQVIVDHARKHDAKKRAGRKEVMTDALAAGATQTPKEDLVALEQALQRLNEIDPRLVQIVEIRFFGGFSSAETSTILSVSERTVERDWVRAKTHLYRILMDLPHR